MFPAMDKKIKIAKTLPAEKRRINVKLDESAFFDTENWI
jgi:hypothetical protein